MEQDTALRSRLSALQRESEHFYTRFVRISAAGIFVLGFAFAIVGVVTKVTIDIVIGAAAVVMCVGVFALTGRDGGGILGRRFFAYGIIGILVLGALTGTLPESITPYTMGAAFVATLAAFTLGRVDLQICFSLCLVLVSAVAWKHGAANGWTTQLVVGHVVSIGLLVVQMVALSLFTGHSSANNRRLRDHVEEIDRLMAHAQRIAKGDLSQSVEGDGQVSDTLRTMLEGLRTMVTRTREAASALAASAQEIAAMAKTHEQGAIEQASAVTQVHRTLALLLEGSSHAAQSTEDVFRNVELTQRTSELVAQRAGALSQHTRRISAILEIIKTIANKSEILALNAALEGARAGEAGRGFSLVASQMQRLAESVMDSIRDVRTLVDDIEAATVATLSATDESTKLSSKATAAARQISVTLQQQRGSTEQVAAAMQDIHQVATQVSAGSSQSLSATKDLTRLADELRRAIEGFQLQ